MFDDDTPALTKAIAIWQSGKAISIALFTKLYQDGYDVPSLERIYRNKPLTREIYGRQ